MKNQITVREVAELLTSPVELARWAGMHQWKKLSFNPITRLYKIEVSENFKMTESEVDSLDIAVVVYNDYF